MAKRRLTAYERQLESLVTKLKAGTELDPGERLRLERLTGKQERAKNEDRVVNEIVNAVLWEGLTVHPRTLRSGSKTTFTFTVEFDPDGHILTNGQIAKRKDETAQRRKGWWQEAAPEGARPVPTKNGKS